MSWPLSQDYNEAIQNPQTSFADPELRSGEAVANALGLPMPRTGNFADVYEFQGASGVKWAVKCFTREIPDLQERYRQISAHLKQAKLPFIVDFNYLDQGIRVGGKWFPVLKMQWVEGFTLNDFVKQQVDKPKILELLSTLWVKLALRLQEAEVAHCDLQHGNILLVPGSKASSLAVKLVDYDGMYVPSLVNQKSGELGHPNFQHPQRAKNGIYNLEVDRFSHLVIYTALQALIWGKKELWQKYDNGDNLLFKATDFEKPNGASSAVLNNLLKSGDEKVQLLARELALSLSGPLEKTPHLWEMPGVVAPETKPATKVKVDVATPSAKPVEAVVKTDPFPFAEIGAADNGRSKQLKKRKTNVGGWFAAACVTLLAVAAAGVFITAGKEQSSKRPSPTNKEKVEQTSSQENQRATIPLAAGQDKAQEKAKAAIEKLRERGAKVELKEVEGNTQVFANLSGGPFADDDLEAIKDLPNISSLTLFGLSISDIGLVRVSRFSYR